jgi:hypothetical protein
MSGEPIDNRSLVRQTLITVGAMLGGSVFLVGTLTLVASSVVGRAVAAPDPSGASARDAHTGLPAVKALPQGPAKSR